MGSESITTNTVARRGAAPGPSGTTVGGRRRALPPGATTIGKAGPRPGKGDDDDATKPGLPSPPDAAKAASDAVKSAQAAALRTRKRLAAGTAGRVVLPAPSPGQAGILASSPAKTLIGGGA